VLGLQDEIYIGVVGSRSRNSESDYQLVKDKIFELSNHYPYVPFILVSGCCQKGADSFLSRLFDELDVVAELLEFPPDTSKINPDKNYKKEYAKIAYERNEYIAYHSDILIACVSTDRKGGTEDTIKRYLKMKKTHLILI
jgi:hypothetical protein